MLSPFHRSRHATAPTVDRRTWWRIAETCVSWISTAIPISATRNSAGARDATVATAGGTKRAILRGAWPRRNGRHGRNHETMGRHFDCIIKMAHLKFVIL